ncbi:hypothetical protein [uncultured Mediterranean phage uvDeep-CGR2-AD7-C12]|nr:hypothetical protein [uncultured Mediterranean phage uvDeep-CGR2-AD7-C12]
MDTPESSNEVATEPAGSTYTVKVDGAESEVSLSELQQGYQRQADYTRKTQELASERQRLEQAEAIVSALEADPEGALTALSSAFGIADNRSISSTDEWGDEPDPTEERIASLEATMAQQARASRQQALETEVSTLQSRYGNFDADALYRHALANRIPNLEAAYAHMNFGSLATYAGKLHEEREITETKRNTKVETGTSRQAGVVTSTAAEKPMSIREAFANAKKEHGT